MTEAQNSQHLPSETVQPTQVDDAPQQASTQPGDGSEVQVQGGKPSFKEQVIGYAQKTRGATLGKQELKQHGEAVIQGQADAREPPPKH
ncbi:unnamed protein product [Peniophora sp. CBMAI 1063]|nr:unnamed protein product [Peniophora sp. CBMAI 1063]